MSQVKVTGNASGTGTLTIAAPNTNSDYTLTLPTNTGTILTSATTTGFPAGSVLQVVEGSTDTQVLVSTTTYTDTGLSASITPTSVSSKILVIFSQQATSSRTATNAEITIDIQLLRGSTVLEEYADYAMFANATGLAALGMQVCATYLDSPNTTSTTTYKLQGRPDTTANSQIATFQVLNRGRSSIVLMEIAG